MGYTLLDPALTPNSSLEEIDAWIAELEKLLAADPDDVGLQLGLADARKMREWRKSSDEARAREEN